MVKLISLSSITVTIDVLRRHEIVFNDILANYRFNRERLMIINGIVVSPSLGFTVSGARDVKQKMINYLGVLFLAYTLNIMLNRIPLIGTILGGVEGKEVFVMNYTANSIINDPEITKNPFSIIAPGQFRNFFN